MSSADVYIYSALRTHIESNKGSTLVYYNGEPFEPPRDSPFFVVTDNRFTPMRYAWGDNCPEMREGILYMNASIPVHLNWNTTQQMGFCANAAMIFRSGDVVEESGVEVRIKGDPRLESTGFASESGTMMHYPMAIPWVAFC